MSDPKFPVSAEIWRRTVRGGRIDANASWSAASFRLTGEVTALEPVDESDIASPWGRQAQITAVPLLRADEGSAYEWGRGFETRGLDGLFFCEILTDQPFGPERVVRIRTRPDLGRNTRNDQVRTVEVEASFLWPLTKGRDVHPWVVTPPSLYCIVPYFEGRVLTVDELRDRSPLLFDYLEPLIPRLLQRSLYRKRPDPDRPWGLSGPFEYLDPGAAVVLSRYIASGGRPFAAVEAPRFDKKLGRETVVFPNNKCNILFTREVAEAQYLAGWLNSSVASGSLERFAAATGITPAAIQRLPIPKFELSINYHRTLAAAAQRCTEEIRAGLPISPRLYEIDALAEEIGWSHIQHLRPSVVRHQTA